MRPGDLPAGLEQDQGWRSPSRTIPIAITGVALCLLLLAYRGSVVTLVETWIRSETFAHCFLVLPMSVWLLWRERKRLVAVPLKPFLPGLLVLALLNSIWLAGDVASVQTLREFALVASVPVLIATLLGWHFAKAAAFPLFFIMFAWPFGDFLVPPLIDYTADFTTTALRLTGVPVFREGSRFIIPSGEWSVVGACSGIRYLLASFFAGSFFAYIMLDSWKRRATFIFLSIAVPIVANWVRAYLIVMIGHLTNNKLAAGADHLIYGWVFFGIVMTGLFHIGMRMSDVDKARKTPPKPVLSNGAGTKGSSVPTTSTVALLCVLVAFAAPSWSAYVAQIRETSSSGPVALSVPRPASAWSASGRPLTQWAPLYAKPAAQFRQTYHSAASGDVELYVAFYRNQQGDSKLLTYGTTSLVAYDPEWYFAHRRRVKAIGGSSSLEVEELRVVSRFGNLLVWQWYWLDGFETPRVWEAKLAQARSRLYGAVDHSAAVVLMAPYDDNADPARGQLQNFVRDMHPAIAAELRAAAGSTTHE